MPNGEGSFFFLNILETDINDNIPFNFLLGIGNEMRSFKINISKL
jgi:hypothetical protein